MLTSQHTIAKYNLQLNCNVHIVIACYHDIVKMTIELDVIDMWKGTYRCKV